MSYPEIEREQHYLPDGISLVQQECPLYNVTSARINASLSIWGLLLFYSPDRGCGIEKSVDPRPLRLIVTEAGECIELQHKLHFAPTISDCLRMNTVEPL